MPLGDCGHDIWYGEAIFRLDDLMDLGSTIIQLVELSDQKVKSGGLRDSSTLTTSVVLIRVVLLHNRHEQEDNFL